MIDVSERPAVNVYHVRSFFGQDVKQAQEVAMHAPISGDGTRRESKADDGVGPPVMVPLMADAPWGSTGQQHLVCHGEGVQLYSRRPTSSSQMTEQLGHPLLFEMSSDLVPLSQ